MSHRPPEQPALDGEPLVEALNGQQVSAASLHGSTSVEEAGDFVSGRYLDQGRAHRRTPLEGEGTPGVEAAPGRRRHEVGVRTRYQLPLSPRLRPGDGLA